MGYAGAAYFELRTARYDVDCRLSLVPHAHPLDAGGHHIAVGDLRIHPLSWPARSADGTAHLGYAAYFAVTFAWTSPGSPPWVRPWAEERQVLAGEAPA